MEIQINVKAKHGVIGRYLEENNMSQSELADLIGISRSEFGRLFNLKWVPRRRAKTIPLLEGFFGVPFEELFPPEIVKQVVEKLGPKKIFYREIETVSLADVDQRKLITYDANDAIFDAEHLDRLLALLPPREEMAVRKFYGLAKTEEPIPKAQGGEGNISRQMFHVLKNRGIRRLKKYVTALEKKAG